MLHHASARTLLICLLTLGLCPLSAAQEPPHSPNAVTERKVNLYSEVTGGLKGSLWTRSPATFADATKRARGELGYPPPGAPFGTLKGAPIGSRFADYNPLDDITRTNTVAYQFVLSENEQYLKNEEHGIAAYKRYTGPKNLVVLPGISHYDVYGKARAQVHALARAWFDKHLRD